jgi:hypothetical protein
MFPHFWPLTSLEYAYRVFIAACNVVLHVLAARSLWARSANDFSKE